MDVGQNPPPPPPRTKTTRTKATRTKTPPDIIPPGQKPSRTKTPFYILFDYSKHSFKNVTLFCYTLCIYLVQSQTMKVPLSRSQILNCNRGSQWAKPLSIDNCRSQEKPLQLLETEIEFLIVIEVVNERSLSLLITVEARRSLCQEKPSQNDCT